MSDTLQPVSLWKRIRHRSFGDRSASPMLREADDRRKESPSQTEPTDFAHTSLQYPGSQIRLLKMRTAAKFKIETWPLLSAPDFAAISYVWGTSEKTERVLINARSFHITPNALIALEQVYHAASSRGIRYVWIDSICIDQETVSEKGRQVAMMGEIFEKADMVFACLGQHADGSEALAEAAASQSRLLGHSGRLEMAKLSENHPEAVAAFLSRPYWSRLWVVQELARASQPPVFLCGPHEIPSSALQTLTFVERRNMIRATENRIRMVLRVRGQRYSLFSLIRQLWVLQCTDPRDRIFGLLGMVAWVTCRPPIEADYNQTRIQLACQAVLHIWGTTNLNRVDAFAAIREVVVALHHSFLVPQHQAIYLYWNFHSAGHFDTLYKQLDSARDDDSTESTSGETLCHVTANAFRITAETEMLPAIVPARISDLPTIYISQRRNKTKDEPTCLRIGLYVVAFVLGSVAVGDVLVYGEQVTLELHRSLAFILRWQPSKECWRYISTATLNKAFPWERRDDPWDRPKCATFAMKALDLLHLGAISLYWGNPTLEKSRRTMRKDLHSVYNPMDGLVHVQISTADLAPPFLRYSFERYHSPMPHEYEVVELFNDDCMLPEESAEVYAEFQKVATIRHD